MLDMTPIGAKFLIKKTALETDGNSFEMEWELAPHTGGTPYHKHPYALETYEILDGEMDIFLIDKWITLKKGESVTVNEGETHTFKNSSDHITKAYNTHQPAKKFDEYFEGLNQIVIKLSDKGRKKLKLNFISALYLSMLMKKFPDEIISVKPPSLVVSLLNYIGKLLNLKL
jgi:mannose-6-phosphate isomerase-like protein (cupin superfamily)